MIDYFSIRKRFNLSAFAKTDTELRLIAAAAIIGFKSGPPKRYKSPAAKGMPITL